MNKSLLSFLIGSSLIIILAFKVAHYEASLSTAEVKKIEGFYIFSDSKPVMPFDSLGVVELGLVSSTQYQSIKSNLIKRARTKYSNADGLIFDLNNKGLDKCIVIKFK